MEYDLINPPFELIAFSDMKKKDAEKHFNWFISQINIRIDTLTKAYSLYGSSLIRLRFRHRFEVNPDYISKLEEKGMVFSGKAPKYPIMQIMELPEHKFFMATQAHPEFNSRPLKPEPLFNAFVKAALE